MDEITNSTAASANEETTNDATPQVEPKPRTQIARYDMIWNPQSYKYETRKTQRPVVVRKIKKKKAILVVKRFLNSSNVLERTTLEVHQEALIEVLQELHGDIEGLGYSDKARTLDTKILIHTHGELKSRLRHLEQASNPQDQDAIEGIQAAVRFIDEDLKTTIDALDALLDKQQITYEYLWTLFRKKTYVYSYNTATDQSFVALVKGFSYEQHQSGIKFAVVRCDILVHDNLGFGRSELRLVIRAFPGTCPIPDLSVYPFKYYKEHDALYEAAVSRGKRYAGMRLHFCEHQGAATVRSLKLRVNERIMVDPESYYMYKSYNDPEQDVDHCLDPEKLSDEDYLICTPVLLGFCFTTKAWGQFAIDRISDIQWSNEPFDRLVLDRKHKHLISALVQQHSSKSAEFDDFVAGKGKGLVGLLCGRPGCGKTLTAEAVAEVTHKPLYAVSAGELDTTPSATDAALSRILRLGERWNAVVLLDEADVYMQERDKADVARNALVSIFLRQVEYHPGILIFTTNLIANIDPAFESRIHFCVKYPDLDFASRKTIWRTFLSKAGKINADISERDLARLSHKPLNGRQIKNVVSTAKSIASSESSPLSLKHVQTVLEVMQDWQVAKSEHALHVYLVLLIGAAAFICFVLVYLRYFSVLLPPLPSVLQM